jgi:hypothetical protein
VHGRTLRLTVDAVRPTVTTDWFSGDPLDMPVAIAELGVPALPPVQVGSVSPACRDDLLSVDGRPVPIRIEGTTADATKRNPLTVVTCGDLPQLSAGEHVLRAAPGETSGFDLDRLVLASSSGGGAASPGPTGAEPTAAPAKVEVLRSGHTSFDLRVTGATTPTWLVLGQSNSKGWHATVDGVGDLGTPEIVDGYANGWRLAATDRTTVVHLRWTPQRQVWVALWLSLVGAVACLGIVLGSIRRRTWGTLGPTASEPALRHPWWATGAPAGPVPTVVAAFGTGVAAGLVVHPLFGLAIGLLTAAALRLPRGRAVGAAAPVFVVATAAFTIVKQWRNGFPPDFGWADFFGADHYLAWAALWLVAVALLTDRLRSSTDKSQGRPLDAHRDEGS